MKPRRRPRSDRPRDLGFTPQPMVQWMAPGELLSAGLRVALSSVFGSYADKRELQGLSPLHGLPDYSDRDDMWLDYVADVADGFDATMSVASVLARPELELAVPDGAARSLPRGEVLVMGGDQVYPTADYPTYRDRLIGPYRAALPGTRGTPPDLYAIPGNHDWYDGLTSFLRVFCQGHAIGGWQTRQERSYFALQLPHRWWLWGIDIQFDHYLDAAQLRFFRDEVGARVRPGDAIVLASAEPSWVKSNRGEPDAYEHLDFVDREVAAPLGAQVRVAIAGDSHHYARYEDERGRQFVTAGGGGAYLAGTHHLPAQLEVPPRAATDLDKSDPSVLDLATTYPTRAQSQVLRTGVFRLPFKNGLFWTIVTAAYLTLAWSVVLGLRAPGQTLDDVVRTLAWTDLLAGLFLRPLGFVMTVLIILGLVAFNGAPGPKRRWGFGVTHAIAHEVLALGTLFWLSRAATPLPEGWYVVAVTVGLGVVGSLLGSWLVALYLLVADRFDMNTNELFAAQHIEGFNNFVRMHVGADGALTLHPVAIPDAATWRFCPDGDDLDPWFEPEGDAPSVALIEPPVRVERRHGES